MKFILFRHGHSLANQESRIVSSLENGTRTTGGPEGTGFGLSARGKQEVAESAGLLSKHIRNFTSPGDHVRIRILTSPFQRTCQTAAIIYKELYESLEETLDREQREASEIIVEIEGQEPEQVIDLRERFFGEFEMKTPSDDLYASVWREDAFNPFHERFGVESVAAVTKRMTGVVRHQEIKEKEMKERKEGPNAGDALISTETWVILVSHGDSLQILQTAMRGWSGDRHRQMDHLDTANWRNVPWCENLAEAHIV